MEHPYATIVICALEEPTKVLEDLKQQTFRDFEVIVAKEKGIVNAMNIALAKAKGSIFIRIDDDVNIPAMWLDEIVRSFQEDVIVAGVTGPTFVPGSRREFRDSIRYAENPHWFLQWLYDNNPYAPAKIYKCGSVSYGSNFYENMDWTTVFEYKIDHLEGTNWAMRTHLIREVGGFDPAFDGVCEWFDSDVVFKVKKLGYKLYYNRQAYLWHMLDQGPAYHERFEGWGRIKNWLRFHYRHSKFHYKMILFLTIWLGYFILKRIQSWKR